VTLLAAEYFDEPIEPVRSGEPGRPIIYQGEAGKRVVLRALQQRDGLWPRDALVWLTDEHLARIADPDSRFEADHYKWERSQIAGRPR